MPKKGDKGPEVKQIQEELGLEADGDYGSKTEEAVKKCFHEDSRNIWSGNIREMDILKRCGDHPNIVTLNSVVIEPFKDEDHNKLVLRLKCYQDNLQGFIKKFKDNRVDISTLRVIMVQLLLGLEYQLKTPKDYLANENGIFFGKVIVFTGELETMTRNTAMSHASLYGFLIGSGVTKKTNCLVVGTQDLDKLAGHEKSSKHRKAEKLIDDGVNIQIITEHNFLKIIQSD